MQSLPLWRVAVAALMLVALVFLGAHLAPIYLRNLELQTFVEELARNPLNQSRPDNLLRVKVLEKAASLGLPVKTGDVRIQRSPDAFRIEVRYVVHVDLPLYTVDLHFYPGAGSR